MIWIYLNTAKSLFTNTSSRWSPLFNGPTQENFRTFIINLPSELTQPLVNERFAAKIVISQGEISLYFLISIDLRTPPVVEQVCCDDRCPFKRDFNVCFKHTDLPAINGRFTAIIVFCPIYMYLTLYS